MIISSKYRIISKGRDVYFNSIYRAEIWYASEVLSIGEKYHFTFQHEGAFPLDIF